MEQAKVAELAQDRESMNPWERIAKNCDLNKAISPGGRDMSRMKSAILNRRADMSANKDDAKFNF